MPVHDNIVSFCEFLKKKDNAQWLLSQNGDGSITLNYRDGSKLTITPELKAEQPQGIIPTARTAYHFLNYYKKWE